MPQSVFESTITNVWPLGHYHMSTNPLSIYCQRSKSKIWLSWHHPGSIDSRVVSCRSSFCVSSYDDIEDKVTKILLISDFFYEFPPWGHLHTDKNQLFSIQRHHCYDGLNQIPFTFHLLFIPPPPSVHKGHWSHVDMCDWKTSNGSICYYTVCSIHKCWISTCGGRGVVNIVNIHGLLVLCIVIKFMSVALSHRNAFLC